MTAKYEVHKSVACYGDLKKAALLWDIVYPFTAEGMPTTPETAKPILNSLLRGQEYDLEAELTFVEKLARGAWYMSKMRQLAEAQTILLPSDFDDAASSQGEHNILITVSNCPVITTRSTSWDQILEIRSDPEAMRKLRNFRLFLHSTYKDASPAFIEDDLARRLEEFQSTVRKHGLELGLSAIEIVLSSDVIKKAIDSLMLGAAGGWFLSLFTGSNPAALVGAGAITVAKLSVEVLKRKTAFNDYRRNHDLAYVFDLHSRLKKNPA